MRKRNRASGRPFLRYELPIILVIALLPEMLMLGLSYFWAKASVEHEMSFLAYATARRIDNILKTTQANLKQVAEQTSGQCSKQAVEFMRDQVFKVLYIREMGIVNDNKLMCNDVNMLNRPSRFPRRNIAALPDTMAKSP